MLTTGTIEEKVRTPWFLAILCCVFFNIALSRIGPYGIIRLGYRAHDNVLRHPCMYLITAVI
jgi:hypothetical protein